MTDTSSNEAVRALIEQHVAAWNTKVGANVARTYTEDARFVINRGEPMIGHADIAEMADGFVTEFPDMVLSLNAVLLAGDHAVYGWTFEGHHHETGRHVKFDGWEEWDLGPDGRVRASLGWFDAADYERQLAED